MITKELQKMKPLKGNELLPRDSEYLGADDIENEAEPILTIKNLYRGKVTLQRGPETKNVITFVEETATGIIGEVRPLIVNSTNRLTLKKLYGQVTANALEGKKIQLYIEHNVRNPAKNELTDGIRIRDKKPVAGNAYIAPKCAVCKKDIVGAPGFTAEQIAAASKAKYGKQMCIECGQKAKAEMENAAATVAAEPEPTTASKAPSLADRLAAEMEA